MNIRKLLEASLAHAQAVPAIGDSPRSVHRARSRTWVEALAAQLYGCLGHDPAIRVFSKHNAAHAPAFGLNELLYDVLACKVGTVPSARRRKPLWFIEQALWQIESEFAQDSRQALRDFNKLVLGSAPTKLFIGPQVRDNPAFIATLLPAALACSGTVYVALIPHPREWERGANRIDLWRCADDHWETMAAD